jgi:hypothetical protein
MDLKTLKLELLERIALIDNEERLLALKRLLDAPRGYGIPNEMLSVVKEGGSPYLKLEDRNYSAAEVQALVDELRRGFEAEERDPQLSTAEWDAIDKDHEAYVRGEGKNHAWEKVNEQLRKDIDQ